MISTGRSGLRPVHHLVLVVMVVLLAVEPTAIGVGSEESSVDVARWGIRLLTYGLAFGAFLLWRPGPIRAPLGWLLAAAIVVAAVSPWGTNPIGDALVGFGIVAVVLYAATIVERLGLDRVMLVVLVVLSAVVVVGAAVSLGEPRWTGLSGGANGYGIQGALLVVLAVHRWLRSTSPAWLALVPIGLVAVVASDSRVALLAIGVGLFMLVRDLLPPLSAIVVLVVVVAGLVSTASSSIATDVAIEASRSGEAEEIATLTGRTDIWASSVDAIRVRPLTGWGITGVRDVYTDAVVRGDLAFEAQDAHNVVVQFAMVGGVLAAALLVAAAVSYVLRLATSYDRMRDALFAVVVLHGLTEAVVGSEPRLFFFVFALTLASAAGRAGPTRSSPAMDEVAA